MLGKIHILRTLILETSKTSDLVFHCLRGRDAVIIFSLNHNEHKPITGVCEVMYVEEGRTFLWVFYTNLWYTVDHEQQLERMQRLASPVLEETCGCFHSLYNWQLLCDRWDLASGWELANQHTVKKIWETGCSKNEAKYTKFLRKYAISDKSPSSTI